MKLDITTIILTYNEELHIRRCLENVCSFSKRVIVVDSPSNDRTVEIINDFNASLNSQPSAFSSAPVEVVVHKYPGNQAEQFNWALDNIQITTEWVMRMDADEYCSPELISEMREKLPLLPKEVGAVVLPLARTFMGRVLKHGIVNGVKMIRLFRYGKARYEVRLMDEHLEIKEGESVVFEGRFVDDSRLSILDFVRKHNNYSCREAAVLLNSEYHLTDEKNDNSRYAEAVAAKRAQKARYAKLPLFWRALAYFIYRYIFKLGFLDGREGFLWDFFQGLWYRMLVDAKVLEAKKYLEMKGYSLEKSELSEEGRRELRTFIQEQWGISL